MRIYETCLIQELVHRSFSINSQASKASLRKYSISKLCIDYVSVYCEYYGTAVLQNKIEKKIFELTRIDVETYTNNGTKQ